MLTLSTPVVAAEALDDAAAYLRLSSDDELTLIAGLIGTALLQCEAFCGQILLRRAGSETLRITGAWQMLSPIPLRSLTGVIGINGAGAEIPISATNYAIDIDESGIGWIRVSGVSDAKRARVNFEAGLASSWGDVPAPLRQGMLRLVAHLHASRDSVTDTGPPTAVAALWRPYRRMRLSGRNLA